MNSNNGIDVKKILFTQGNQKVFQTRYPADNSKQIVEEIYSFGNQGHLTKLPLRVVGGK